MYIYTQIIIIIVIIHKIRKKLVFTHEKSGILLTYLCKKIFLWTKNGQSFKVVIKYIAALIPNHLTLADYKNEF